MGGIGIEPLQKGNLFDPEDAVLSPFLIL